MKLYGIANCSSVKKARAWLDANAVAYTFHDFKKLGMSATTLENWLLQMGHEKLINRAGLTWRGLNDAEKAAVISNASAITLMQAKTSVIKRPVLEKDGVILTLGFSEAQYQSLLFSHRRNDLR